MSRPRTIDQNGILDAAEAVVARDGAARLTLDAVAREAGIAKASVIYDYKSKQALVRAVIERRAQEEQTRIREAICALEPKRDACILGRISAAAATQPDQVQAVGVNLVSALAQDAEIRSTLSRMVADDVAEITRSAEHPRSALVAFLAVEGMKLLDFLGLQKWSEADRCAILHDIAAVSQMPIEPAVSECRPAARSLS